MSNKVHGNKSARRRRRTWHKRPRINDNGDLLLFVVEEGSESHCLAIPPLVDHHWEIRAGVPLCVSDALGSN